MWHWGSWVEPLPISEKNWQVRHGDQPWYHKHWIGVFVGTWPIHAPGAPCIEFRIRKGEDKGRKRERSFTSIQMLHTHPAGAGSTLKGKRKKKADTRRADGQKQRRGGRGTDGPPEPTYTAKRTWPKTAHTPKPHDTLRRGTRGKLGTKWGTS